MSTIQTLGLHAVPPNPVPMKFTDPRCDCECGQFLEGKPTEVVEGRTFIQGHIPPSWRQHAATKKSERDSATLVQQRDAKEKQIETEHSRLQGALNLIAANREMLKACLVDVPKHEAEITAKIDKLLGRIPKAVASTDRDKVASLEPGLRTALFQKWGNGVGEERWVITRREFAAGKLTVARLKQILNSEVV